MHILCYYASLALYCPHLVQRVVENGAEMNRSLHMTITAETEEQNVEKIKTVFPNSLQGNGRTSK